MPTGKPATVGQDKLMTEKRQFIRHDAIHLIDYQVIDREGNGGTYSMGRTLDVSVNGLKLETTHALDSGTRLQITVGLANELIELTGIVSHTHAKRGRFISGISFNGTNSDNKRIFSLYVDAFNKMKKRK
jgi:hypothetical protein